jgi:hypothetical protein
MFLNQVVRVANPTATDTSTITKTVVSADGIFNSLHGVQFRAGTTSTTFAISSVLVATATRGQTFNYQIIASNSPKSYNARGLPANLSVDTSNGLSSGIPTVSGSFSVTVSATNPSGTGQAVVALTVADPTPGWKGAYYGILQKNISGLWGAASISINSTGRFTLSISINGHSYALHGVLAPDGSFMAPIPKTPYVALLQMDATSGEITGTLSSGGNSVAQFLPSRSMADSKGSLAALEGRYTFILQPDAGAVAAPQADGYGTLTVSAKGAIRASGKLGDGTSFTQGVAVTQDSTWPLFAPLYNKTGFVSGVVTFEDSSGSNLDGTLTWVKPNRPKDVLYPGGFSSAPKLVGSSYVTPPKGTRVLAFADKTGNATFSVSGGDLNPAPAPKTLTLSTANTVSIVGSEKFTMSIALATGLFSGNFLDPGTGKLKAFSGAVFQIGETGSGLFIGNGQTGTVLFEAQ